MIQLSSAVYERTPQLGSAEEIFEDMWRNVSLFYSDEHYNTTVLLLYPNTIDTINLQASHLDPEFAQKVAGAIQRFRLEREIEGFAITHEIRIEEPEKEQLALYISDLANGIVMFYRHKDLPEIKVRVAYAEIGKRELKVFPPKDISAPDDGVVNALSFDLNILQQYEMPWSISI